MKKRKILALLLALSLCTGLSAQGANFADDPILGRNDDGGLVYTDKAGNVVIDASQYDRANEFRNGLARVCRGEQWGLINAAGEEVVPCQYDHITVLDNGTALLEDGGEEIYVDAAGQEIEKPAFEDSHSTQIFQNPKGNSARNILEKYTGEGGHVVIPDYITEIGNSAFEDCTTVTSITIPNSVTELGYRAFYGCTALENIILPDSITEIGLRTFYCCTALKNIILPDTLTTIGDSAFRGCTALESITIPDSVTEIDDEVFKNCTALKSIAIPNGVTQIKYETFWNCPALTDVTLPDSLTEIREGAFLKAGLTSVVIPNGVTEIGNMSFVCDYLNSVFIPESVTEIAPDAFGEVSDYYPIIYGKLGSYAHQYALEKGIPFVSGTIPAQRKVSSDSAGTAFPSRQSVTVDGERITFPMYALKDANGDLTNYVRVRDLAAALNGTAAQFDTDWLKGVLLYPGSEYEANGSELRNAFSGEQDYYLTAEGAFLFDADTRSYSPIDLAAILLVDENGGGYTYYQLRDLGRTLGFNVGWDVDRGVFVETDQPYDPNN